MSQAWTFESEFLCASRFVFVCLFVCVWAANSHGAQCKCEITNRGSPLSINPCHRETEKEERQAHDFELRASLFTFLVRFYVQLMQTDASVHVFSCWSICFSFKNKRKSGGILGNILQKSVQTSNSSFPRKHPAAKQGENLCKKFFSLQEKETKTCLRCADLDQEPGSAEDDKCHTLFDATENPARLPVAPQHQELQHLIILLSVSYHQQNAECQAQETDMPLH